MIGEAQFCPRCGTERLQGMQFCGKCGLDFGATSASGAMRSPEAPRPPQQFETIEIVDRDSGQMPAKANVVATVLGTGAVIRHYMIGIHRWPGGSEEVPIVEYGLSAGVTPENMTDRSQLQVALDEFASQLTADGWELEPRGPVWYSRTFRRPFDGTADSGALATPEAVAAMEQIRAKATHHARQAARPMGTSLSVGSVVFWFLVLVLAWVAAMAFASTSRGTQGTIELLVILAFVVTRVRSYRAWKREG